MAVRAITTPEQTLLRTDGQWSEPFLAGTEMPPVVFACQVDGNASTHDQIAEFSYDNVTTGAYADILPGMTILIGSSALHYDWGIARARKAADATKIYIGEGSEIDWTVLDNKYVTVLDEMDIWAKHVRIHPTLHTVYMDYDVEYADQHEDFDPVPVMGGNMVVDLTARELIVNGTFDTNTEGWTEVAPAEIDLFTTQFRVFQNSAGDGVDHAYQNINTVIGSDYLLSLNVVTFSHGYGVYVDNVLVFSTGDGDGIQTVIFTATSNITEIAFRATGHIEATFLVDDVSVTLDTLAIQWDCSESWVFDSTISTRLWEATEGTWDDATSATPLLTIASYPTGGTIRVSLTLTAANGKSFTGYRYIKVYDEANPPFTDFSINECSGDFDTGGFSFSVTLYGSVTRDEIRDRTPITLFANDYYGNTRISLGQHAGRENIIATGWVDGETIVRDLPKGGSVTFTVQGPQFWLNKISGFPQGTQMAKKAPAAWTDMPALTVDRALWHLLHWRSTLTAVCDVILTGDTRYAKELASVSATLWEQIKEVAFTSIFAVAGFDQYGRMFAFIHPQLTSEADRTWETIQTFEETDWLGKIETPRRVVAETSMLSSSGVAIGLGGRVKAYFSLANGHVFKRYGRVDIIEKLLLNDQTHSNELCGLLMGKNNNQYPDIPLSLAENNRMFTLFPQQWGHYDLATGDTPRGITFSRNLFIKGITYQWNPDGGSLTTDLSCEAEAFPENAMDGDIPGVIEPIDIVDPPEHTPIDPIVPIVILPPNLYNTDHPKVVLIHSSNHGVFYTETFNAPQADYDDIEWIEMNDGLDATDMSQVNNIVTAPSGAIFMLTNGDNSNGWTKVMYAEHLGGTWATLFEVSDIPGYVADGNWHLTGIGVNPTAEEEIAVFGGRIWTWPYDGHIGQSFFSLVDKDTVSPSITYGAAYFHGRFSDLFFSNGGWNVLYSAGTGIQGSYITPAAMRFSNSGTYVYSQTRNGTGSGYLQFGCPVGTQSLVYAWESSGSTPEKVDWNGAAFDLTYSTPIQPQSHQSIGASPTGTILMAASGALFTPFKSVDSGVTWASVAGTIPAGPDVWENCRDNNRWIFAGGTVIRLTLDVGDTYFYKEGNLSYIAPLIDISLVRFIE